MVICSQFRYAKVGSGIDAREVVHPPSPAIGDDGRELAKVALLFPRALIRWIGTEPTPGEGQWPIADMCFALWLVSDLTS